MSPAFGHGRRVWGDQRLRSLLPPSILVAPTQLALKGSGFFGHSQVSSYFLKRADPCVLRLEPEGGGLPVQLALLWEVGKVGTRASQEGPPLPFPVPW